MIDIIGALYEPAAPSAPEPLMQLPCAGSISPGPRLWGFHVNITPEALVAKPSLQSAVKTPPTYQRVWEGDDPEAPGQTVALRFNGENAAREALGDLWPAKPA